MIEIKIQSLISFLDITIPKESILSIKKGFGNKIAESLFELVDDIKTFIKSGIYKDVDGYIITNGKKVIITISNVKEELEKKVEDINKELNNRFKIVNHNFELYCTDKDSEQELNSVKSLPSLLKYLSNIRFTGFKIYTNCGVLYTYHEMIDLDVDCKVTSIQYTNDKINLIFKHLSHEQLLKIINYHLKHY